MCMCCVTFVGRSCYRAKGKLRLVVDGGPGNPFGFKLNTTHESSSKLLRVFMRYDCMAALDSSAAYRHLAIRECDREFMAISVCRFFSRFPTLPFGWCNSPYCFTEFYHACIFVLRSARHLTIVSAQDGSVSGWDDYGCFPIVLLLTGFFRRACSTFVCALPTMSAFCLHLRYKLIHLRQGGL